MRVAEKKVHNAYTTGDEGTWAVNNAYTTGDEGSWAVDKASTWAVEGVIGTSGSIYLGRWRSDWDIWELVNICMQLSAFYQMLNIIYQIMDTSYG